MKKLIESDDLELILKEETNKRNALEEHTLDWYTFDNRIKLINKVISLLKDVPTQSTPIPKSPKKTPTKE